VDGQLLTLSQSDVEFVATKAGIKNDLLNPERWLIRYQFLELIVRLGISKYFRSKLVSSKPKAVEKLFEEHLDNFIDLSKWDCHKMRVNKIWKEEIVMVLDRNKKFMNDIYAKYS
jgi:hypothetical protein